MFSTPQNTNSIIQAILNFSPKYAFNLDESFCLPNNKILALTKLEEFADDSFNIAKIIISFFGKIENIVGKGENAGNKRFLLFPWCFQKLCVSGLLKVGVNCVV